MSHDRDVSEIKERFEQVYGVSAEGHPLFTQFVDSLGRRGKSAILNDIDEAEAEKKSQRSTRGWDSESMTI